MTYKIVLQVSFIITINNTFTNRRKCAYKIYCFTTNDTNLYRLYSRYIEFLYFCEKSLASG